MDGTAVKAILEAADPYIQEIDGQRFSNQSMKPVIPQLRNAVGLESLSSLWNYMAYLKGFEFEEHMLLIVRSFPQVSLVLAEPDKYGRTVVIAQCDGIRLQPFEFGGYLDQATIMTALQTQFVQNDGVEYLLKFLGSLADSNVIEGFDNGLSQSVTVKKSVASKGVEHVQRVVELRPYRTFIELEQPESPFIVRMKARENQLPLCALIETDGGKWKIGAMEKVRTYLNEAVKEIDAMSLFTVL